MNVGARASPAEIEIVPCDPARDGELIRTLTRANFYDQMQAVWNEARHQQEPLHPDRYRMIRRAGETIGFFALREETDHLYVQTIQLVPSARGAGIGTRILHHVRGLAADLGARAVRLRVLLGNEGARRLYERLGYVEVDRDEHTLLLERVIERGTIVLLNGPSSAGKTTLARALRGRLGATAAAVSVDDLFRHLHPAAPNDWETFAALNAALLATARSFAHRGLDVVIDTVFERAESLDTARRALAGHRSYLVAVACPLSTLEARERARGDRRPGHARRQFDRVLQGARYDLVLDTSLLSVEACVDRVVALLAGAPRAG